MKIHGIATPQGDKLLGFEMSMMETVPVIDILRMAKKAFPEVWQHVHLEIALPDEVTPEQQKAINRILGPDGRLNGHHSG